MSGESESIDLNIKKLTSESSSDFNDTLLAAVEI